MYFEESYFEGEEREGFYIEPMMKRAWAAQLEVLQVIDDICVRHNIEYFAEGGTLLGAVRHGGYIPWDDDLDIEMKRMDYERFLKVAERELPKSYKIRNAANYSDWDGTFSRVVNTLTIPLENEQLEQFHGFPYTVGVDIFPLDYLPIEKSEEDIMIELFRAVYMLAHEWNKDELSKEEKMASLAEIETFANIQFVSDKPYPQQLWVLADRIGAMYWDTGDCAKEVALVYWLADRPKCRLPISCYADVKRVPFENTTIPIPVGFEQILIAYYGEDYILPKRGCAEHEYPFYKKQQELLRQIYKERGLKMPQYLLE